MHGAISGDTYIDLTPVIRAMQDVGFPFIGGSPIIEALCQRISGLKPTRYKLIFIILLLRVAALQLFFKQHMNIGEHFHVSI